MRSGMPRRGRDSEEEGGASQKRQRPGMSVQDAAASEKAHPRGLEESSWKSLLAKNPVTVSFSMRCDAVALEGRKEALDAALRKVATEFGGLEFRLEQTRVGPSDDTLQRILPSILEHVGPDVVGPCYGTCKAWRRELEARGFCRRTWHLCSTMANNTPDATVEKSSAVAHMSRSLAQIALSHEDARGRTAERAACLDANAFLQTVWGWGGGVREWLQAASQEPSTSFLSQVSASVL